MRIEIPGPNARSQIRDRFEAAKAYRFPSEVPTKTDSPGFRAGVEVGDGSSAASDQTAIEVTLPESDRVVTFDPSGIPHFLDGSAYAQLSLSAYRAPSEVPTYSTKSR